MPDVYPYGHTGRELRLMLEGQKPLAMFYDDADLSDEDSVIPYEEFDPYVQREIFSKAEQIFDEAAIDPRTGRPVRVKYVLYAVRGEEWRIPAMWLLMKTRGQLTKRDEGLDRMESALLGYSDAEIEAYHSAWQPPA